MNIPDLLREGSSGQPGITPGAHRLLDEAQAIFKTLGTLDEPARVEAARDALDRDAPIPLLVGSS